MATSNSTIIENDYENRAEDVFTIIEMEEIFKGEKVTHSMVAEPERHIVIMAFPIDKFIQTFKKKKVQLFLGQYVDYLKETLCYQHPIYLTKILHLYMAEDDDLSSNLR